jgi:opacity protein-like surface antigen
MKKSILTFAGSALIALSMVQFAAATEPHEGRTHHRAAAQFRNSNAYVAPVAAPTEWSGYAYSGGYSAPAGR